MNIEKIRPQEHLSSTKKSKEPSSKDLKDWEIEATQSIDPDQNKKKHFKKDEKVTKKTENPIEIFTASTKKPTKIDDLSMEEAIDLSSTEEENIGSEISLSQEKREIPEIKKTRKKSDELKQEPALIKKTPRKPLETSAEIPAAKKKRAPKKKVSIEEPSIALVPLEKSSLESTTSIKKSEKSAPIAKKDSIAETQLPPPLPQTPPASVESAKLAPTISSVNEIDSLYQKMVSVISSMEKDGVSETIVTLNSPSFQNSPFFGARIFLQKYSTAPDSFNIRLTGSQEAVALFQANLDSFVNLFQTRQPSIRLGRISAEYETERPIFRRPPKSEKGGKDSQDLGKNR